MNTDLDFDLVLYGGILLGVGALAHRIAPGVEHAVLISGVGGGAAAMFWGVLGLRGFRRRIWPISTLIVLDLVLLVGAGGAWLQMKNGNEGLKKLAVILTVLLVLGMGQLAGYLREGKNNQ